MQIVRPSQVISIQGNRLRMLEQRGKPEELRLAKQAAARFGWKELRTVENGSRSTLLLAKALGTPKF